MKNVIASIVLKFVTRKNLSIFYYIDRERYNRHKSNHQWPKLTVVKYHVSASLVVFEHNNYRGAKKEFTQSSDYVGDFWNDKASSLKAVAGDWEVYQHSTYRGTFRVICQGDELTGLPGFNNQISSVKLVAQSDSW